MTTTAKKKQSKQRGFKFSLANSVEGIKLSITNHLTFTLGRDEATATPRDWWTSTCMAVRDRLVADMMKTQEVHYKENVRRAYYLSLEYLMGRMLTNNCINAGIDQEVRQALAELELDLDALREEEVDMGLGNGGLGRLAACFLDSLATLDLPAIGYGIHYEYGLFRQEFINGHQVEHPDNWMVYGTPWEIVRPEYTQKIPLYGHVETSFDDYGRSRPRWVTDQYVLGVPYDIPIAGYNTQTVNFLRLWASRADEEFDFNTFNEGGYVEAVRQKVIGETVSKVLYPNDRTENGKELRLVQQYFFVSCSLHDIIRRFRASNNDWNQFPEKVAIQLNDTHPAVAVAELMRILVDEVDFTWDAAWSIVTRTLSYTNHTLLPEALERWAVPLFEKILPRHLQIIYEINRRFLEEVEAKWPGDDRMKSSLSLIEESQPKMIRMAHLAVVGSHTVNGVAALHSRLLKEKLFHSFDELYPGKLINVTNGITPRRWLRACNPRLSELINTVVKGDWPKDLELLHQLEKVADDSEFQKKYMEVKRANKSDLVEMIAKECGVEVSPDALFDVQIKRLHEYKRQHLNLLHILTWYRRLLQNPDIPMVPRVFLFAAKAAPGYELAKCIIKAINSVGHRINHDTRIQGKLKVVFIPNYRVTLAARIIPASDLSEQISTAGKEASGTGNMKLALNGALTIGTLDGANVEIRDAVGEENIFIFGHTVEQVHEMQSKGYNPWEYYYSNDELRSVIDWVGSNYFTPDEPHALAPLKSSLLEGGDPYMVLADFEDYLRVQSEVEGLYRDPSAWARAAILNTARMGFFSSDRTIRNYAEKIWKLAPVKIP